ncbi:MAG: type III-B CRISPR module-associated Cmr3 family protein [Bacteroidales bacterium]
MAIYRFKLKPLEPFFFGGEKHILEGGKILNEYFMNSTYYPQQTTLLGMLRFLLLKLSPEVFNGTQITDKRKAVQLIGERSFDGTIENFGAIKKLSPLFFWENQKQLIFQIAPRDLFLKIAESADAMEASKVTINGNPLPYFFLDAQNKRFNSKKHLNCLDIYLIDEKGESVFKLPEIFDRHDRIGIETHKPLPGDSSSPEDDPEDKYYRQVFYSFKKNCSYTYAPGISTNPICPSHENNKNGQNKESNISCDWYFMFEAEINDDIFSFPQNNNNFLPQFIQLGGERVHFRMVIEKMNEFYHPSLNVSFFERKVPMLYLLSDAFMEPDKQQACSFAITRFTPFRHLMASVQETQHYGAIVNYQSKSSGQIKRSQLFNLIQRGSVFYFLDTSQRDNFIKALKEARAFFNIGFNQFITNN